MQSIKDRVLIGLDALGGKAKLPRELEPHTQADEHSIVHTIYRLNKDGLVAYREKKLGTETLLTKIRLTNRGRERLQEIQR